MHPGPQVDGVDISGRSRLSGRKLPLQLGFVRFHYVHSVHYVHSLPWLSASIARRVK